MLSEGRWNSLNKKLKGVFLNRWIYGMTYPCLALYIKYLSLLKVCSLERVFDWTDWN